MDKDKLRKSATTDGQPPRPGFENAAAPAPIEPHTGMHEAYWILSDAERAKGFVRPVRMSYVHIGRKVCGKPRDDAPPVGYAAMVCVMPPGHDGGCTQWTGARASALIRLQRTGYLGGCGTVTRMNIKIAETYARDPKYYGSTFCVGDSCRTHFPVGEFGEFVWDGTDEKVGT